MELSKENLNEILKQFSKEFESSISWWESLRRKTSLVILLLQLCLMLIGVGVVYGTSKSAIEDIAELKDDVKSIKLDQRSLIQARTEIIYINQKVDRINDRLDKLQEDLK